MLRNYKHSDFFMLAVIRGGVQKNYILHKSCTLLAMDALWLLNPDGKSQACDYLAHQEQSTAPFGPLGYGCVLVSFDDKTVYSFQTYKDVSVFKLDEVGFMGASAPSWMDWNAMLDAAFDKECVTKVIYSANSTGREVHLDLPRLVRERKSLTLRYASRERPTAFSTVGLGFAPQGWLIRHENVANKSPARESVLKRVVNNLVRLRATMAPESEWAGFATPT